MVDIGASAHNTAGDFHFGSQSNKNLEDQPAYHNFDHNDDEAAELNAIMIILGAERQMTAVD